MKERNDIKVLIAEDVGPIRKRYVDILNGEPDITVISDVGTGKAAVENSLLYKPDVILMDIEMETKDAGLLAAKEILCKSPETKIIILTVYEEDEMIFTAFQLGICDYMLKSIKPEEVVRGVRSAFRGNSTIRPEITPKIRSRLQKVEQFQDSFIYILNIITSLTSTELDILYLLSKDYSRSEICKLRHVEMSTVKTQIHNILHKFNQRSIIDVLKPIQNIDVLDLVMKVRKDNDKARIKTG